MTPAGFNVPGLDKLHFSRESGRRELRAGSGRYALLDTSGRLKISAGKSGKTRRAP